MARLVVDTNILSRLLAGDKRIARALKGRSLLISFVTDIGLHAYPHYCAEDQRRVDLLLRDCALMGLNENVWNATIRFRKTHRLKLPDALIAATAEVGRAPLMTTDRVFLKCREIVEVQYLKP